MYLDDPPSERRAVAIWTTLFTRHLVEIVYSRKQQKKTKKNGQIGSSEKEHSVSPLHECGIDCQPTSDSCVRRRHSGAILRHFYSLLLTELRQTDIHGLCNAPSVYCRRRIRNVLVTVTVTVPMRYASVIVRESLLAYVIVFSECT